MPFQGCLQLGFSPKAMDWKNEDFYTILKNIKDRETDPNTEPYTRGWNTQGQNIKIGTRVFVYYAKEKKFIASGYICGLIVKLFFNGKERNWAPVTFDWLVDYEVEDQGLKYQDLKDRYNLSIPFFEQVGQLQGGRAFLQKESDLDILEKAWAAACPGYHKDKEGWMKSLKS